VTIKLGDIGEVLLIGDCSVEDADVLIQRLLEDPSVAVDWTKCTNAHTAIIQVLMAAGRLPEGVPKNSFLEAMVGPALRRDQEVNSAFPKQPRGAKEPNDTIAITKGPARQE
jgi:hypothetical protein